MPKYRSVSLCAAWLRARNGVSALAHIALTHTVAYMPTWSEYVDRLAGSQTAKAIAARVGVDSSQVSRWKTGQAPTAENAIRFAEEFDGDPVEALIAGGHAADITALKDRPAAAADHVPKLGVRTMEEMWTARKQEPAAERLVIELAVAAEELNARSSAVTKPGKDLSLFLQGLQLFVIDTSQLMSRIHSAALEVAGRDPERLAQLMDAVRAARPGPYFGQLSKQLEELLIAVPGSPDRADVDLTSNGVPGAGSADEVDTSPTADAELDAGGNGGNQEERSQHGSVGGGGLPDDPQQGGIGGRDWGPAAYDPPDPPAGEDPGVLGGEHGQQRDNG